VHRRQPATACEHYSPLSAPIVKQKLAEELGPELISDTLEEKFDLDLYTDVNL